MASGGNILGLDNRFTDRAGVGLHALLGAGRLLGHHTSVRGMLTGGRDCLGLSCSAQRTGIGLYAIRAAGGRSGHHTIVPLMLVAVGGNVGLDFGSSTNSAGVGRFALISAGGLLGHLASVPGMFQLLGRGVDIGVTAITSVGGEPFRGAGGRSHCICIAVCFESSSHFMTIVNIRHGVGLDSSASLNSD